MICTEVPGLDFGGLLDIPFYGQIISGIFLSSTVEWR